MTAPEERSFVVRASHSVPLKLMVVAIVLIAGSLFNAGFLRWAGLALGVALLLLAFFILLPRMKRPVVTANATGVTLSQTGLDSATLAWNEILSFEVVRERGKPNFAVLANDPEAVLAERIFPPLHDHLREVSRGMACRSSVSCSASR